MDEYNLLTNIDNKYPLTSIKSLMFDYCLFILLGHVK